MEITTENPCEFHSEGIETVALTFRGRGGKTVTICWDCLERMKAKVAKAVKFSQ